ALGETADRNIEDRVERERADRRERAAGVDQRHDEVVVERRIRARAHVDPENAHGVTPSGASVSLTSNWLSARPMRSTTNSNGLLGATPTSATSSPASRCAGGLLVSSQRT